MENSNDRSSYRLQAATGFIVAAIVPTFTVRQRIDADFWLLRPLDVEQRWLGAGCILDDCRCIHDAVVHIFDESGGHLVIGAGWKAAGEHLRRVIKGQWAGCVRRIEHGRRTQPHQA
jgi:hypothetical protein